MLDKRNWIERNSTLIGVEFINSGNAPFVKDLFTARDYAYEEAQKASARFGEMQSSKELLDSITERWGNTHQGAFAGRLLEFQQRTSFNMNAVEAESEVRAQVTEFEGLKDPHAPADVNLVDSSNEIIQSVQTKSYGDLNARVDTLSNDKYEEITKVVPSDHLAETNNAAENFEVQSTIEQGGIESDPITYAELQSAAIDPKSFFENLLSEEQKNFNDKVAALEKAEFNSDLAHGVEILETAAFSGGVAGALGASIALISNGKKALNKEITFSDLLIGSINTGFTSFIKVAKVASLAEGMQGASEIGILSDAFQSADISTIAARTIFLVADSFNAYFDGEITKEEAAKKCAVEVYCTSFRIAGASIGQSVIPIPIVGTVVGTIVGTFAAEITIRGIQEILRVKAESGELESRIEILKIEVEALERALVENLILFSESTKLISNYLKSQVTPVIHDLSNSLQRNDFENAFIYSISIAEMLGASEFYKTIEELDKDMNDPGFILEIRVTR